MQEEKIREVLYDKMMKEYNEFINNVLKESPENIIKKADEISAKSEMLIIFDPALKYYDIEKVSLLNELENPLEELYIAHVACNSDYKSLVENNVELFLDDLEYKENKNSKRLYSFIEEMYYQDRKRQIEIYKQSRIEDEKNLEI